MNAIAYHTKSIFLLYSCRYTHCNDQKILLIQDLKIIFAFYFCFVRSAFIYKFYRQTSCSGYHEHNAYFFVDYYYVFAIWCVILNCSDDIYLYFSIIFIVATYSHSTSVYFWNHDHQIIIIIYIHSFYGPKSIIIYLYIYPCSKRT